jgi:hypothetical protein
MDINTEALQNEATRRIWYICDKCNEYFADPGKACSKCKNGKLVKTCVFCKKKAEACKCVENDLTDRMCFKCGTPIVFDIGCSGSYSLEKKQKKKEVTYAKFGDAWDKIADLKGQKIKCVKCENEIII